MDRAADNHYPTMTFDQIKALRVPAADDCVLFMWATVPMLPQALAVIDTWGFQYKTHFVWVKDRIGTGYWNRNTHEILLVATRSNVPAPAPGMQYPSVITAPAGRHSEKPAEFAEMIERYYPTTPKLEMFARAAHLGWDVWGNEVDTTDAATATPAVEHEPVTPLAEPKRQHKAKSQPATQPDQPLATATDRDILVAYTGGSATNVDELVKIVRAAGDAGISRAALYQKHRIYGQDIDAAISAGVLTAEGNLVRTRASATP